MPATTEYDHLDTPLSNQFYWLFRNMGKGLASWASRNKLKFVIGGITFLVLAFVYRSYLQGAVLAVRINIFPIFVGVLCLAGTSWLWRKEKRWLGGILFVIALGGFVGFIASKGKPREYLGLYWHYNTIDRIEIDELPVTEHERIQPLNSIRVLAGEAMAEVEHVAEPDFIRDGDGYYWTMAVEPSYTVSRLTGKVTEVMRVSASAPSPNFSKSNRSQVSFLTGEALMMSRNAMTAARKRFGLIKFLNYEPANIRYLRGSEGEWLQVISLIRWKGIIFPRPVFGGVLVIEQTEGGVVDWATNMLVGSGDWIAPDEIGEHDFLEGQNIVPNRVSRFSAQSFRFQEGFTAPMPGYHVGDIRIPDLPGDYNDQPFTAYFEFGGKGKLYHYFALEPYQDDKQGLNTSVFVPADGIGDLKVYKHHEKGDAMSGVSAIVPKIMESRKNYDWERNSAAEQRPFIRDIAGKRRFFWLTTVVTYKNEGGAEADSSSYIAGSAPDVTLTDALYKTVIWVDAKKPETWEDQLVDELKGVWGAD